ncbi:unnamed protein product [Staurois parvus]|uniref:Uncharacterized protein n=1 Tax=Staurois parvus TaxID=386267 RepID=A0ABN9BKR9_9NEOB|nr:unnamed protein product [Staurois parvus]
MQSGKYRSPRNRQTPTYPLDCQTEKRDWSHQRTRLPCSRVQWWLAELLFFPSCFHFGIIPLTVERGIFSSQEMSRMDLLHRWPPITGPRLESLSS